MNPIVINGTVLCDNITGIPRYVYENVVRLDKLIEGTGLDVRIAYRDDGRPIHLPELKNIRLVPLKSIPYFYNLAVLPAYLRRTHAFYVGLASDMLLTRRSVVVLHDIRPLVMDTDKGFFRFKFWVHCLSTKWFAQRVFTVSDNQRHLISEKLGIPLDATVACFVGRLGREKSVDVLLRFWAQEMKPEDNMRLMIVGDGPEKEPLEQLAKELKITDTVVFTGKVVHDELPPYIHTCDIYVTASLSDTNSISMLEGMAGGLPVLQLYDELNADQVKARQP